MNLKKVMLELSVSDVQQVLRFALDEDAQGTLRFIKQKLAKQWRNHFSLAGCRYSRPVKARTRRNVYKRTPSTFQRFRSGVSRNRSSDKY